MPDHDPKNRDPTSQRALALARWENDGGAGPDGPQHSPIFDTGKTDALRPNHAELGQLRIRVIALENLVIALLGEASERQLCLAREMAAHISPRPGFTRHPITIHAAARMSDLVNRARHFRSTPLAPAGIDDDSGRQS